MNDTENEWVSRKEAAELLGVTVRTIDRYSAAGYITRHQDARGRIAFNKAEVLAMNKFEPETTGVQA